jgi:hypothetical protein
MPTLKKIVLPPRPATKPRAIAKPAAAVAPAVNFADLSTVKAISYVITLDDGTSLQAKGEHADLIFKYLSECERFCAQQQMINYLGPSLSRYAADGTFLIQGKDLDDAHNLRS